MPLKSETTIEYYFNKPYMFYCSHHDCLRVAENHEDSILLNGIPQDVVNDFIKNYFEYVLDDVPMKEYFLERLNKVKEAAEDLTDSEDRPL